MDGARRRNKRGSAAAAAIQQCIHIYKLLPFLSLARGNGPGKINDSESRCCLFKSSIDFFSTPVCKGLNRI